LIFIRVCDSLNGTKQYSLKGLCAVGYIAVNGESLPT